MVMIIKNRARKPIENRRHSPVGYAPNGIGGVKDKNGSEQSPSMVFSVGDHRVMMTIEEFHSINTSLALSMKGM